MSIPAQSQHVCSDKESPVCGNKTAGLYGLLCKLALLSLARHCQPLPACCRTVKVLNDKNLVWRDPRMPNVVRHLDDQGWMTHDFDTVNEPGLQAPDYRLRDWDDGTLEAGVYNTSSDLHQVAVLPLS